MKFILILICLALLCSCSGFSENKEEDIPASKHTVLNYDYMKAVWLSQYDLFEIYTNNGEQREKNDFEKRIVSVLDNVVSLGMNTIIVQVRPFGDSMYPSEFYPLSSFVVGEYGNKANYDPFEVIVSLARDRELSVHAWINPLRAMTEIEMQKVDGAFSIRKWYDEKKYISNVSGRWYLDPAYPQTRELICNGVSEIIKLYDVDGIHIDDYFYPTMEESFDKNSYESYKANGGKSLLADFRRENINSLVREIYSTVKAENKEILFGVSPSGVTNNNYNKSFADVALWCKNDGYVDYICPQIYFGFEHSTCAFDKVCLEFSNMIKSNGIRLIIGMTLGKSYSGYDAYAGEGKYEWRDNGDILLRQLEYTVTLSKCSGVSYFSYQYFFDPLTGERIEETLDEVSLFVPYLKTKKLP